VSELVAAFAAHYRDAPLRPLVHLPALHTALNGSDIWSAGERLVDRISAFGLAPGELVVSAVGNRPECVALLLACRRLDLALMPVDAGATTLEIEQLTTRFGARMLITPAPNPSAALPRNHGLTFQPGPGAATRYPDTAILKLTSGSTGLPRAVAVSETQLIADSTQIMSTMEIGRNDTQIAVVPLSHAYGLSVVLVPLIYIGTPILLRESFVPQLLPADARTVSARRLPGVPFMFDHFLAHPPPDGWPVSLTRIVSAGAKLPAATAEAFHQQFGVKIHGFYGTTETGGICYDASDVIEVGDRVGRPLHGVTLSLIAETDVAPPAGRVHVTSAAVGHGYIGGESGDFVDGGFLTGDLGTIDAGELTLIGRVSAFINVAGRKVQPEEVEAVLRRMSGVADVRVLAAADARRGQQVAACIVIAGAQKPDIVDVRRFCARWLAPHKIPRVIVYVDSIPLTPRGKTNRAALEELVRAQSAGTT
jgi:long-chain acyl-CoA synthetase